MRSAQRALGGGRLSTRRASGTSCSGNRSWRLCGRRAPRPAAASGEDFDAPLDEESLRQARRKLDRLYFAPGADAFRDTVDEGERDEAGDERPSTSGRPELLTNLPLWRVQWAMVPGTAQVLNVHVPHYCHMFEEVMARSPPWRFGHFYLPGGSENLQNPEYALKPGSKAVLTGALMEIQRAVRMRDGRIALLAHCVARLRAVAATQAVPFSRADCVLLPDAEERAAQVEVAMQSCGEVAGDAGSVERLMGSVEAAADSAAAAAAQVWWTWEARAVDLQEPSVVTPQTAQEEAVALQALMSADEVPLFPVEADLDDSLVAAIAAAAQEAARRAASQAAAMQVRDAEAAPPAYPLFPLPLPEEAPATDAGSASGNAGDIVWQDANAAASAAAVDEELAVELAELAESRGLEGLLALEARCWQELDALCALAARISSSRPLYIPQGLRSLRPTTAGMFATVSDSHLDGGAGSSAGASGGGAAPSRDGAAQERTAPGGSASNDQGEAGMARAASGGTGGVAGGGEGVTARQGADASGVEGGASGGDSSWGGDAGARGGGSYADAFALRRLQRLSFVMISLLSDVGAAQGRQALLEVPSIGLRLRAVVLGLRRHRRVLAAVVSLKDLGQEGTS